jgi:hypothetical protein
MCPIEADNQTRQPAPPESRPVFFIELRKARSDRAVAAWYHLGHGHDVDEVTQPRSSSACIYQPSLWKYAHYDAIQEVSRRKSRAKTRDPQDRVRWKSACAELMSQPDKTSSAEVGGL